MVLPYTYLSQFKELTGVLLSRPWGVGGAKTAHMLLKQEVMAILPQAPPLISQLGMLAVGSSSLYEAVRLLQYPQDTIKDLHYSVDAGEFKQYKDKWSFKKGSREVSKTSAGGSSVGKIADKQMGASANGLLAGSEAAATNTEEKQIQVSQVEPWLWSKSEKVCHRGHRCVVDEIHFRRGDDLHENGGFHQQVIATITVKAPSKDVWAVLTSYENLPEFIPNLANSTVLFREEGRVRLLQEGCKSLLYMVLHSRVVLDLWEHPGQKITFKQVEGDCDSFQGNWVLTQAGSHHTLLKYTIDTKIGKDCFLAEPIVEKVIYEDLPSNLCAFCDRVESLARILESGRTPEENGPEDEVEDETGLEERLIALECLVDTSLGENKSDSIIGEETRELLKKKRRGRQAPIREEFGAPELVLKSSVGFSGKEGVVPTRRFPIMKNYSELSKKKRRSRHPPIKGLMDNFAVLEREIKSFIASNGKEGFMPTRSFLRECGRIDLEKAITAMGGFQTVAARMKLSLVYKSRKPDGYWDKFQNLRHEVISFQKKIGIDMTLMPSRRVMEKAGRYDLARALEKWGGLTEVARMLGLEPERGRKWTCKSKVKATLAKPQGSEVNAKSLMGIDIHSEAGRNVTDIDELHARGIVEFQHSTVIAPNQALEYSEDSTQRSNDAEEDRSSSSNNLVSFPSNQAKQKKMPYKTVVPQESSKWLPL